MTVSEYRLLERCFEDAFGFMLNRLEETHGVSFDRSPALVERASDQCWNEFMLAIEGLGIDLKHREV